jgi:Flp pilus assembly protein CpaB
MEITDGSLPVDHDAGHRGDGLVSTAGVGRSDRAPTRRRKVPRRRLLDRVTVGTVFGVVAALLAFVLTVVLLRDRREMVTVAVATERIPVGLTITESMVEAVEVPASVSFVDGLVRVDELGTGSVAARTVQPGEAVTRSALGAKSSTTGARVMAIPVESWRAVGGELDVGDQVDVIDTGDGGPRYVLSGAAVVGRATSDASGGIVASSSRDLWVTVEVTATEALELAAVIAGDEFLLVRSTGAEPPALQPTPSTSTVSGSVPAVTGGGG